jgi:hypothetical protein
LVILLFFGANGYISVFEIVINFFCLLLGLMVFLLALEVVSQRGVLEVSLDLELPVWKVEKEDAEEIVGKAYYGNIEGEFLYAFEGADISAILYGLQEEEEVSKGEEDADEDVDHDNLVAQMVLGCV